MIQPTTEQLLQTGLEHHRSGRFAEAERIYRQVLSLEPNHADALNLLGMIFIQTGQSDSGIELVRRAITINANVPNYHTTLGNGLASKRLYNEAIAAYRRTLELNPNYADAYINLGVVLSDKGEPDAAIAAYRQALRLVPENLNANWNMGNALRDKGLFDDAIAAFRKVCELKPDFAPAYSNLGVVLSCKGLIDEAIAMYHQSLRLDPNSTVAYCNLGRGLCDKGLPEQGIDAYRKSIELNPQNAEAYGNLGNALRNHGLLDESLAAHREAIRLRPDRAENYNNMANVLRYQGFLDEAIAAHRQAVQLNPASPWLHSNLVFALHYHPQSDPKTLLTENVRWARLHADRLKQFIPPHNNDRSPDRRLKIGYVSPDFREHPVGRFLLPFFANHDPKTVEIFCYSDVNYPDSLTQRLRGYAHHWRSTVGVFDPQMAQQIHGDQIDILIDLTSHTADSRLLVFARKPAPVQATWLAYPGTTGLDTIDYRITDPYIDPPGSFDEHYTERSIRLPETFWCYQPSIESSVNPPPAAESGLVTFGCLNNFSKITDMTLQVWCKLLAAVPNSRLLLHARAGGHRERVSRLFAASGIDPARLEFVGKLTLQQYMEQYHSIDIGLDPFPYVGGTTTCDALWMGVPIVTLRGQTAVGRTGVSVLMNVGLVELIAENAEQYVQIAAALAGDLPRLAALRSGLRERMKNSPLMDAARFAQDMEAAYRQMWTDWCLGRK